MMAQECELILNEEWICLHVSVEESFFFNWGFQGKEYTSNPHGHSTVCKGLEEGGQWKCQHLQMSVTSVEEVLDELQKLPNGPCGESHVNM